MKFSYNKLWDIVSKQDMSKEKFRIRVGMSSATLAAMNKGAGISPKVLIRICTMLSVQPGDVMEIVDDTD